MADSSVSLDELRERLAMFQEAYERCVMIDDWQSVIECQQRNRAHIERIKESIARREAGGEM
jgi:hypothetical protein